MSDLATKLSLGVEAELMTLCADEFCDNQGVDCCPCCNYVYCKDHAEPEKHYCCPDEFEEEED